MARADKLKHGPIAWRTALCWLSRRSLAFAAVAPAIILPPVAVARLAEIAEVGALLRAPIILASLQSRSRLAKFAKGHAGLLFGARGRWVVEGKGITRVRVEVRTNLVRGYSPSSQGTNRKHAIRRNGLPLRYRPTAQAERLRQGDNATSLVCNFFNVHDPV